MSCCICTFNNVFKNITQSDFSFFVIFFQHQPNADTQVLGQIEICFSPDFTLMDCEKKQDWDKYWAVDKQSGFSVCDHHIPVCYPLAS